MWDQPMETDLNTAIDRIIPTYVGSTVAARVLALGDPNHSHVCGINDAVFLFVCVNVESFPRMWDQPSGECR